MDLTFLPCKLYNAIFNCDINSMLEIRLRCGFGIKVNLNGNFFYLAESGATLLKERAIICQEEDINAVINNVTEHSIYAFNDKIKNGYLTTKDGVRIGITGECVCDKENIITIKNFSSLNIRIPNERLGCADKLYNIVYSDKIYNTLIISPPLYGKTTLLKDLARKFNVLNSISILVIDERGEFFNITGENIDRISNSNKSYAFTCGLRSMSPNLVITDELCEKTDWIFAKQATVSGVKVIASCHGTSLEDVLNSSFYIKNVFERFVVLETKGQAGVIGQVYNGDYKKL